MKYWYRHLISFLLIIVFMMKIVGPAVSSYKSSVKSDIEQQEEKSSEEGSSEKASSEDAKIEIAEIASLPDFLSFQLPKTAITSNLFLDILPVQYFAVPTPPPRRA